MKYLFLIPFLFPSAFTNGLFAQAGELDYSFSEDGMTTTSFGSHSTAYSVAIQSDGKIVAAGVSYDDTSSNFSLARYNTDGTLDNSFNGVGITTAYFGSLSDHVHSVLIQSDGKILVAGKSFEGTSYDFALARYNTDGTPDNDFSGDGITSTVFGSDFDAAYSVAVQSDGKIVVAGASFKTNTDYNFALARYNTDGTLDNSFSGDGITTIDIVPYNEYAFSVAIQSDGKIVVAGVSYDGTSSNFALVRFNTDGTLDNDFSGDGMISTDFGFEFIDEAHSIAIQSDGKIVVAGSSSDGISDRFALARYNTDGTLDSSFSGNGMTTTDLGSEDGEAQSVAIQSDGKIVVAGYSFDSNVTNFNFALARYNTDGTLDAGFSSDGITTIDFGSNYAYGHSVAIQYDGKIIVAGSSGDGTSSNFGVARYFSGLETGTNNDSDSSNEELIYPNPSNEYIIIEGDYTDNTEIINTLGQSVPARIENSKIDIRWLPDGAYLLKTETKDHRFTISKFIKRKT